MPRSAIRADGDGLVTALAGAGQFTLFSYFAPYFKNVIGAGTREVTLLFVCFGVFGVVGNTLGSRYVDRFGAERAVAVALVADGGVAARLAAGRPTASSPPSCSCPGRSACFSTQSMQQARLGAARRRSRRR